MTSTSTTPRFLTTSHISQILETHQTPLYVYSEQEIVERAQEMLAFPHAYGLTVKFAMKANANKHILRTLHEQWLHFDAGSHYEVHRAISAGIPSSHIQLCSQELPKPQNLSALLETDAFIIATSLHQLEQYASAMRAWWVRTQIGIRINPGIWSWDFAKINTGWPSSSFGIRHEYLDQAREIAQRHDIHITKLHCHIWSENTPESRSHSAKLMLWFAKQFPDVTHLNMWGWFKMAIMPYETTAPLQQIWAAVQADIEQFATDTGRELHLEIEPGKYLVINACSVLSTIQDICDTWPVGHTFLKLDSGMTEMPRVTMYGVQEPLHIYHTDTHISDAISDQDFTKQSIKSKKPYVVVWHCCESGDLHTCKLYEPEVIEPRELPEASIWDIMIIDGVWAYNASMSMKHYNSFPEAAELMITREWEVKEIRKRQVLEEVWKNEG